MKEGFLTGSSESRMQAKKQISFREDRFLSAVRQMVGSQKNSATGTHR